MSSGLHYKFRPRPVLVLVFGLLDQTTAMAGNNLFIVTVVTEEEQIKSIFQVDVDDDNNCTICAAVCGFHLSSCQIASFDSKYAKQTQAIRRN